MATTAWVVTIAKIITTTTGTAIFWAANYWGIICFR
jgi:hypothetical protein